MLRVVIDTNVFVSSLLIPSRLRPIREALKSNDFLLLSSPAILNELLEVMNRPKIASVIDEEAKNILIDLILGNALFVAPVKTSAVIVKEDPSDDHFLLAAKAGKADLIVSGDGHLLSLKAFHKIPIIPPGEFIKILNNPS